MVIKREEHRYFSWKWFVALVVLAVLIWGVWAAFFSYATCDNWDCFNGKLEECGKVKFIGGDDMIFEYTIQGIDDGECEVGVQLLQGELNRQDSIKLEGHKMTCMLPEGVVMIPGGVVMIPGSDIGERSGLLKEGLQDLLIKKMHTYLVQNLGQLNLEVLDIPEVS